MSSLSSQEIKLLNLKAEKLKYTTWNVEHSNNSVKCILCGLIIERIENKRYTYYHEIHEHGRSHLKNIMAFL